MSQYSIFLGTPAGTAWAHKSAGWAMPRVVSYAEPVVRPQPWGAVTGRTSATGGRTAAGEGGRLMALLHRDQFEELAGQ